MWNVESNFSVRLGGNTYVNTPNLIVYKNKSIFSIRRNDDDGMLGIDFDVFDENGQRIATFAKGVVVQGNQTNYEIISGHDTYSVTERATSRVIACVRRRGVQSAELDVNVRMYLPDGFLLDAGPDATNLQNGSLIFSGNMFMNSHAGISIG